MGEWKTTWTKSGDEPAVWSAPENEKVLTKIHDADGERNLAVLTRRGNLWWTDPNDGMYVYYTPTHWYQESP